MKLKKTKQKKKLDGSTLKRAKSALTFIQKGNTKKFKLYDVAWKDHSTSSKKEDGWVSFEEAKAIPVLIYSVGYLVDETSEAIAIAQNVGTNGMVSEVMTILRSCIVSKTEL